MTEVLVILLVLLKLLHLLKERTRSMPEAPRFTMTNESITVVWEGNTHTVKKGTPQFTALRSAIIEERWDDIPKNLTVAQSITTWWDKSAPAEMKGKFAFINNRQFRLNGEDLPGDINGRIISMATKGESPLPLLKFWERLQKNPSKRSVDQLWPFLQHQGISIDQDGFLMAYKGVNSNMTDKHTGQFDNSPGKVHEMPRNKISDDPREACHEGFHVGARSYASSFASRTIICKVDPADVVCVPYDSNQQKMRVCKYEVLGHDNGQLMSSTTYIPDETSSDDGDEEDVDPTTPEEMEENEESGGGWECDECGSTIPQSAKEGPNSHHKEFCSLFDPGRAKAEKKADTSKPSVSEKKQKPNAKLDKMGVEDLMKESIDTLRQYATKNVMIIGASKIPGGKTALVAKILEARK